MAQNSIHASVHGYSRDRRPKTKPLTVATAAANTAANNGTIGYAPQSARSQLLAGLRTTPRHQQQQQQPQPPQTAPMAYGSSANPAAEFYAAMAAAQKSHYYQMQMQQQMQNGMMSSEYENPEMDAEYAAQIQATEAFLLQRQQLLQNQLMQLTAQQFGGLSLGGHQPQVSPAAVAAAAAAAQQQYTAQTSLYAQQLQSGVSPIPQEVPGQPGLYLVYNPLTGQHTYAYDTSLQQQLGTSLPPNAIPLGPGASSAQSPPLTAHIMVSPTLEAASISLSGGAGKRESSVKSQGASSRHVSPPSGGRNSQKSSSRPSQSSTRESSPPSRLQKYNSATPQKLPNSKNGASDAKGKFMTPFRQPYTPPPIAEIREAPDSSVEGCKNFASMRRGEALKRVVSAGINRRNALQTVPTVSTPTVTVADYGFGHDSDSDSTASSTLQAGKFAAFGALGSFTNPTSMVLVPGTQVP